MMKKSNIVKFQKNYRFNIGIVMVAILLVYVLFHIVTFLTDKDIKVYEVKEGSISSSVQKEALALRSEEVYTASNDGEIKYFKQSFARVGAKSIIYSIDKTGSVTDKINSLSVEESALNTNAYNNIYNEFVSFSSTYTDSNFARTGIFKDNILTQLGQINTENALTALSDDVGREILSGDYVLEYAPGAGLFMLTVDGFEDINIDNFDKSSFDPTKVEKVTLHSDRGVKANDVIYKLVTSDRWNLIVPASEDDIDKFQDESYINVKFKSDDYTTYAKSSVIHRGTEDYINLEFDDSIERYADNRFMTIELLINNKSGLKIPNMSITTKEFYCIPKNYFMKGADSNALGIMLKKASGNEFVTPTIYHETKDMYYIDGEKVSPKDYILKPDSNEEYRIDTKTDELMGVYNVNKGYAVFKQIKILDQNKEYTIVDKNTDYGIAVYDRIVLDGSSIEENEMI